MTTLAQLHDCHSCNDERSIVQKKHGDQQVFGWPFGFSLSSCWFALTKEHLLS